MESANLTDRVRLAIASGVGGGVVCYSPTLITTNGIWKGSNPLEYSLPLFIIQVILVVVTTRVLVILLKPLHQPRVVAEIIVTSLFTLLSSSQLFDHRSHPNPKIKDSFFFQMLHVY